MEQFSFQPLTRKRKIISADLVRVQARGSISIGADIVKSMNYPARIDIALDIRNKAIKLVPVPSGSMAGFASRVKLRPDGTPYGIAAVRSLDVARSGLPVGDYRAIDPYIFVHTSVN